MDIRIRLLTKNSNNTYLYIRDLLSQLYNNSPELTYTDLDNIIDLSLLKIFIVEYKNKIIATGTLVDYKKLVGYVGVIEDFVVGYEYRDSGVGSRLIKYIIDYGHNTGIDFIDVNTRRKDAKLFYEKNGFILKGIDRKIYSLRCKL